MRAVVGRGKQGFVLGCQSLFLVDIEGFPVGHEQAPTNMNEQLMVESLLERVLGEDLKVELAVVTASSNPSMSSKPWRSERWMI